MSGHVSCGQHVPRRYIIVGGTTGMGFAAARVLARAGASVVIIGRDPSAAADRARALSDECAGQVLGEGGCGIGLSDAIARGSESMGGLDGIAITAGPISARGTLLELSDADWQESFETQLMTVVRATRVAIPLLAAGGGGSIVTTAAMSIRLQKPTLPHYAAMKAAIATVTKNIALTFGRDGIRANCIAPGAIATEALSDAAVRGLEEFGGDPDQALWKLMSREWGLKNGLDRIGTANEVGELIAFLLSSQAGYLTGAVINIDGGSDF